MLGHAKKYHSMTAIRSLLNTSRFPFMVRDKFFTFLDSLSHCLCSWHVPYVIPSAYFFCFFFFSSLKLCYSDSCQAYFWLALNKSHMRFKFMSPADYFPTFTFRETFIRFSEFANCSLTHEELNI